MTKGQSAGNGPIAVKLKKINLITGVHVGNQKTNHFVMDRIKELSLLQLHIKQKKLKKCFSVHVNKLTINHSVMVLTTNRKLNSE